MLFASLRQSVHWRYDGRLASYTGSIQKPIVGAACDRHTLRLLARQTFNSMTPSSSRRGFALTAMTSIFLPLIALLLALPAHAQTPPLQSKPACTAPAAGNPGNACAGNPINLITGNK
ncbi:hypothetical protein QN362_16825, partial [Actimicrobium sp. CCC2.4]|uniref:hypothetical protein n=1 Tax=Actimicrobium sp. CCC2.4 TaxID=3048606 RepID=UPI002B23F325